MKTDYSDQKQYRKRKHKQNKNNQKNGKKDVCMGISSDKKAKSHTRKLGHF